MRKFKIKRLIGKLLYCTIGRLLPAAHCRIKFLGTFSKWFRGGVCGPLMLKHCGKDVNIYKGSKISASVELGDRSDIGMKAQIFGKVIIGNDVIMGPEVVMYTKNHCSSRTDIPIKYQGSTDEKMITIEDGVWIGHGAFILPGVTVGEGSIIAARSVVTKNVPPFTVVAGNPGKIVKYRK